MEFVIVGPVAFLMILAILEVGCLAAAQDALEHAVDVAGRWAAINSAADTPQAVAQHFAAAFQNYFGGTAPPPTLTVAFSGGAPTVNGTIQMSAAYVWTPAFGIVPFGQVPLSVDTTLPIIH